MEIADDIITSEEITGDIDEPIDTELVDMIVPQQVIDEESGTMNVAYAFPPHENGTIFPPKELTVFLTAEAAICSENYLPSTRLSAKLTGHNILCYAIIMETDT